MREAFVAPGAKVSAFVVAFEATELSWESFRNDVVGATDPAKAVEGSLRAEILEKWEDLGLASKPSMVGHGERGLSLLSPAFPRVPRLTPALQTLGPSTAPSAPALYSLGLPCSLA